MKKGKKKHKVKILILGTILFVLVISFILLVTKKSIVQYPMSVNPTEEFCINGYFLFPDLYQFSSDMPVQKEIKEKKTIFNIDVLARDICFIPTTLLPEANTYGLSFSYFKFLDTDILKRNIQVRTDTYPDVVESNMEEEINADDLIKYEVTYMSSLLEYSLVNGEKSVLCNKSESGVECNVSSLGLEQGGRYDLNLVSTYDGNIVKQLGTYTVGIKDAVRVESGSINEDEVLLTPSVSNISLLFNKEVESELMVTLEDGEGNPVGISTSVDGTKLSISVKESLKQGTKYVLKLNGVVGKDGSHLDGEYVLRFSVSDGPKVSSTNIGSGFSTSGNIVLTFNQSLKSSQNIRSLVKINSSTDYSYIISKNKVTINPNSNLALCSKYSISVGNGVVSSTGLVSSSGSSYTLKTTCKRTVSIGTSVQGRKIYAYYFGTGSKKIVFFGSIHGSESNTKVTMEKWVSELDINFESIPKDKTVIVIPTVNPDGVANRSRFNVNGVDLNRNFDTDNWAAGTYLQSNYYPNGGGAFPFSEPESVAIRDFVRGNSPYLTLTYHSAAGYVVPSNTSTGTELGKVYSNLSGYKYIAPGTSGAFSYDITGTFEEWAEQNGYSALVVELSSAYSDQFAQNKSAMWEMVKR